MTVNSPAIQNKSLGPMYFCNSQGIAHVLYVAFSQFPVPHFTQSQRQECASWENCINPGLKEKLIPYFTSGFLQAQGNRGLIQAPLHASTQLCIPQAGLLHQFVLSSLSTNKLCLSFLFNTWIDSISKKIMRLQLFKFMQLGNTMDIFLRNSNCILLN